MSIKSEWKLLKRIDKLISEKGLPFSEDLVKSIGDDAAVFELGGSRYGLITTDISIENQHFRKDFSTAYEIGYKAMIGNISDISAMGGEARFAFISLGCPKSISEDYIEEIYSGMLKAANNARLIIAGGDISNSQELIINITVYGEVNKKHLVTRSGANTGDQIYVTGNLGDSQAGLNLLLKNKSNLLTYEEKLIANHKMPPARHNLVPEIISIFSPTAMIDVSDGLVSDLRHICEESNVGFLINESKIPVSNSLKEYCEKEKTDPVQLALQSGEEYQLLFTSHKKLNHDLGLMVEGVKLNHIGSITEKDYQIQCGEKLVEVEVSGFDHFKG